MGAARVFQMESGNGAAHRSAWKPIRFPQPDIYLTTEWLSVDWIGGKGLGWTTAAVA